MKIDKYLLTEKDIENIKFIKQIDLEIQKKIQIEYDRIADECVKKYSNVNYEELKNSDSLKYIFIEAYRNTTGTEIIILGSILFLVSNIVIFNDLINGIRDIEIFIVAIALFLGSIWMLYRGIVDFIARRKIKKNFESLGIGDEL
jgi:hypothetical protein